MLPALAAAAPGPKGSLVIIGGGSRGPAIMQEFLRLAGGSGAVLAVFPMASSLAATMGEELTAEFRRLGAREVRYLNLSRAEADSEAVLERLKGVTGVYFAGGDQSRLMDVLRGTRTARRLHELYRAGAAVCGTSAGAAVMSRMMITGDERFNKDPDNGFFMIRSTNILTAEGFGFLENAIVDQHFLRRKRHNRLLTLVLEHPQLLGIGIDEATAVVVRPGGLFEVFGDSTVLVLDAAKASKTTRDPAGNLAAAGLQLHLLRSGDRFDLSKRKPLPRKGD